MSSNDPPPGADDPATTEPTEGSRGLAKGTPSSKESKLEVHGRRPTVMFVDDEQDLADMYSLWLEDRFEVLTAYSGEEALESIEDVDIVFLDRRMPGLSGDEVLDRIIERDLDCPVVMLSAIEPDFEVTIGYDKYLTKPVTESTLHETVNELLLYREVQR